MAQPKELARFSLRFARRWVLLALACGARALTRSELSPFVVLKFGGTSVSTRARWDVIADVARQRLAANERPVIVCSAISGCSDALEEILEAAPRRAHAPLLESLRRRHEALAESLQVPATILDAGFAELEQFALGASLIQEVSPRLQARVMAFGEQFSTRLGVAFLQAQGLVSGWLDARDALTSVDPVALPEARRFLSGTVADDVDPRLQQCVRDHPADVVVTQGFIARSAAGDTVLLGRGGSDTSAAYFAAKLGAKRCEIWTDVPGIYSANPREVPTARLLMRLEYDEAQEIATTGAKVLHPRCIAPCRKNNIPLSIHCTDHPTMPGTVVRGDVSSCSAQVKAISAKNGIVLISMDTLGMWQQVGFLADIFQVFKDQGVSVDLVSTSESNVTVSLDKKATALTDEVIEGLLRRLAPICQAQAIGPCTAISVVGRNIRTILHQLGPALRVFEERKIYLVSQAANDLNVTFVVDESEADALVARLHALLIGSRPQDPMLGPTFQETFGKQEPEGKPARPPWWQTKRASLLAMATQESPLYVYDEETLEEAARSLIDLKAPSRIFYAIKANPHPAVLRCFRALGLGFECVSPGEIAHVRDLFPDLSPDRILFTPNFAPRAEYEAALALGVHVTVDALWPLQRWPEIFRGKDIFIRIDPGKGRGHHAHVRTAGSQSKFGVAADDFDELAARVDQAGARVVGLHAHAGSGIRQPETWQETAIFLANVAERFPDVRVLDVGGGLGIPEKPGQSALDVQAVDALLCDFRAANPRFELWLEPGRYLVARAGVLLASVTQTKRKGETAYVGINAGMNSLLRPALYGAYHEIVNLTRLGEPLAGSMHVVGPICETGDTLGHARKLPDTTEGDVILIATAGAYGHAMSSRYNLREPAQERLLERHSREGPDGKAHPLQLG